MKKPLILKVSYSVGSEHDKEEEEGIPFGLGPDLVYNRAQDASVALLERGAVWVRHVKVVGSILCLQQREQTTSNQSLSVQRRAEVMRRVPAGWDISQVDDGSKRVLSHVRPLCSTTLTFGFSPDLHHRD